MTRDTILLLTTSYPESADGSEAAGAFVADLAAALAGHGPVRVVGPGRAEQGPVDEGGIQVWRFAGGGRPLSLLSPRAPSDWPKIARVLRSMQRQAESATRDGRVAHVIALWMLPSGWIARRLLRSRSIPYSVWALGSDIWSLGRIPGASHMLQRVARSAQACFADGLQLAEEAGRLAAREFEFLPSTRKALVHNASPPGRLPPWNFLFLGRWHPNKGIDLLLEALELLPAAAWSRIGTFTVAGGGPMEEQVRAAVARLRENGRPVELRGFLSARDAGTAIQQTDWLVIPSRIESIPVVLSDALKAGRPVIATAVGDMARIVGGSLPCGIVVSQPTAAAISRAIEIALMADPTTFAKGVAEAAGRFDLDGIAARIRSTAFRD